jgi:hypothetical protein
MVEGGVRELVSDLLQVLWPLEPQLLRPTTTDLATIPDTTAPAPTPITLPGITGRPTIVRITVLTLIGDCRGPV